MTFLARWLLSFTTKFSTILGTWMLAKNSIKVAAFAAMIGLTAAFAAALKVLIAGTVMMLNTSPWIVTGINAIKPDNFEACIGAMLAAKLAAWAYRLNKDALGVFV